MKHLTESLLLCIATLMLPANSFAQSVCLPAPRLLTTIPIGARAGTVVDVTITGDNLDDADELRFSHPAILAVRKLDDAGQPVAGRFMVTVAEDCPVGVHEARVTTNFGISSSRIFSVSSLPEFQQTQPNTSLESAMTVSLNSICNAEMTSRAVDFYRFDGQQGQRVVIDCAARGVDSKLTPVLILADAKGNDLTVERRGGVIDFTPSDTVQYVIKVHDLTFNGGPEYFYRLALQEADSDQRIARLPSTSSVSSCSWPPVGISDEAALAETEPNNKSGEAQRLTLPCDVVGSFFPAADVDVFEFDAKKGDVWWCEVASERFGLATDPLIVVQHVRTDENGEQLTDVAELSDIPSPVKVSSNGYAYDGPPYNAGSSDINGRIEVRQDGLHRLQLRDLFGGTRNEPGNVYRMIIRKAAPDFALVAWAMHMELRNGDRNALSKPIALRCGATMPLEVVAIRRDGFDGEIELAMENLPDGVSAAGVRIPAGQSRGMMLITADQNAPPGLTSASFFGRAVISGETVTRPCRLTSLAWPVPDSWQEIPSPRLLADVPVSVSDSEVAPITIAAADSKVWEATAGTKLSIPLVHTRRSDFSGASIRLKTFGVGFERVPAFDAALTAENSEAVLDLAALKTPPGEYVVAFYGSAVARYRIQPDAEPKDIVDIVVSTPITVRVHPAQEAEQE